MEPLELRAGIDPELLHERASRLLVGVERLDLSSRAVEGQHQLPAQPLARRMRRDEHLELRDELAVPAQLELGVDSLLQRRQPELLEPPDLVLRELVEREVREGGPSPERQRPGDLGCTILGRPAARLPEQALEPRRINAVGVDPEHVPGRLGHEELRPDDLAELGDEVLQRGRRRPRGFLAPDLVDQAVGGDDLAGVNEQRREQRALLLPSQWERAAVRADFERPEDAELEHSPFVALVTAEF